MADQKYDLEDRTYLFARDCRFKIKSLSKTIINVEDGKQLVRASGSVGANYIEANEALSKKDFLYRLKICRKEAKESKYWICLLNELNPKEKDFYQLEQEAEELKLIFSKIINNSS